MGVADEGVEVTADVEVAAEVESEFEDDGIDVIKASGEVVADEPDGVAVKLSVLSVLETLADMEAVVVANGDEASALETAAVADVIPLSLLVSDACAYSYPMSLAEWMITPILRTINVALASTTLMACVWASGAWVFCTRRPVTGSGIAGIRFPAPYAATISPPGPMRRESARA